MPYRLCSLAAFLIASSSAAYAEGAAPTSHGETSIFMLLLSALVGSASALVTETYKEFFAKRIYDKRSKSDSQHEIFRNYAAPLINACEKLIWRFDEIFLQKRHHFLKTATLPLVFNEYKRRSTLYRIGTLLGWMRAINLELSSLPRGASGFAPPIADGLNSVQSALADGPYVEMARLEQICEVWKLDLNKMNLDKRKMLATHFEMQLYNLAGDTLKHDSNHLRNLTDLEKEDVCFSLSVFLCKELGRAAIDRKVIAESVNGAIASLSYREALIYRDWQDAIGDALLEKDDESVRRFRMVGFERFEHILAGDSLWIEVFRDSIVDIDFDAIDPTDFRGKQLSDLAISVSRILIKLSETNEEDLISKDALARAKLIVEKLAVAS